MLRPFAVLPPLLLASSLAWGQDSRHLAATCAACHGDNGRSTHMSRALAGLPAATIAAELRDFRAGTRAGTVMPHLANGYSDADIDRLAAWFAQQPRRP